MGQHIKVILGDKSTVFGIPCSQTLAGYNIETILVDRSGPRMLEAILQHQPDVVLSGIFMAEYDIISLMRLVRNCALRKKPIFMIFSNKDSYELEEQVLKEGALYYFFKPANYHMIAERILQFSVFSQEGVEPKKEPVLVKNSLDIMVSQQLYQAGVPVHVNGYSFIRTGVSLVVENPPMIGSITKELYPEIAKMHDSTASKVERSIRNAIELTFRKGNLEHLQTIFQNINRNDKKKPTNSEFIATLADRVRLQRDAV